MITPMLLLLLAAGADAEITIWHSYNGGEREALNQTINIFNKTKPGFKVVVSAVPYDALADKLTAAIPRGHGPDIFIYAHDRVGGWAEGGQIQPIELLVTEPMLDEHETPCVFALAYGDSLYGLPLAHKALALFVRTDKVKELPTTFDELLAIAKKATEPKKGRYGLVYGNIDLFFHTPLLFSLGGHLFPERSNKEAGSRRPNVVNDGVVRSLALAHRLAKTEGIIPDDPSQMTASSMFSDGRAPMVISGPWFRSEIDKKVPYTVIPIPAFPMEPSGAETGGTALPDRDPKYGERSSGFSTCEGVLMSAKTKYRAESFQLMKFLSNDPRSAALRMHIGKQPVTLLSTWQEELEQLSKRDQGIFRGFQQAFAASVTSPSDPAMAAVWTPMNAALYKTIHQGKDPKISAEQAQKRIDRALK